MRTVFRKRQGRFEEWHFHIACPDWPEGSYVEQAAVPPAHELCIDCLGIRNNGIPNPSPDHPPGA
ncbi:MAG TPA: hypothetical protein VGA73_02745 [Candidatus Binatia bacterium]